LIIIEIASSNRIKQTKVQAMVKQRFATLTFKH